MSLKNKFAASPVEKTKTLILSYFGPIWGKKKKRAQNYGQTGLYFTHF